MSDVAWEDQTKAQWQAEMARFGEERGFFEALGDEHSALYVKNGKTLIVTFENLDHVYSRAEDRMPWGYDFVTSRGWSMLGLMAHGWTWYRDEAVFDFFDRLRDEGFFAQFDNVVFYGASMGGYAAAAFSSAAPGANVICISPQATLDRDIAGWETRYHKAWRRSYSGRYGYAPDLIEGAQKVSLFYDPRSHLDAMHAALFRGGNLTKYRCRFMGHRLASLWQQMGVLKPVVEGCVAGSMTEYDFYRLMRNRREIARFQKQLLKTLEDKNRPGLIAQYCAAVLARRRAPHFRRALRAARLQL
ncbi:phosphoadenosine phosphosulfate reductase [Shimia sp. MMG029]|uniref:phosphoadenosine phosphosulfate reductase n=1 Tax=Shimia sp. MMG029 TaxID=3021978 RepID=UPI0022FF2BE0|nr:phosphoadenosine phosphosulfate reductase [Shimia sp. MMG029]MDA5558633.1 phosphoadenosine phosphosulfate reductase [Shimia sp. MMG029]